MRKVNKKIAAVAAGAIVVSTAGAAYAYWTTTGGGTGTASTTAGQAEGFTVSGGVPNAMFPGDAPQTATATVTNKSTTESAYLNKVTAYITTNKDGCTGADFLLNGSSTATQAAPADLGFTAVDIAKSGTATKNFTLQFNNTGSKQDACKSAVVTINYVAS